MSDATPTRPATWTPPVPPPESILTERLEVRFWRHEDAAGLFELISSSRDYFLPWLPWAAVDHHRVEESTFYIERCIRSRRDPASLDFALGIIDRASGRPVGGTGFHRIDAGTHQAEIGYFIRADAAGRGLCTEATAALLTWGFRPQTEGGWGFRRIEIRCAAGNAGSAQVCRKLGLRHEATLVKDRWIDGRGWDDTLIFGALANEWTPAATTR